jgi:hypothetical protein
LIQQWQHLDRRTLKRIFAFDHIATNQIYSGFRCYEVQ